MNSVETRKVEGSKSFAVEEDAFSTFNEILGEIGPYQIWTTFLILLSGISVAWMSLSFVFLAKEFEIYCAEPKGIGICAPECEKILINETIKSKSIVYQWNLYCERAYKKQLAQSVLIAGIMFGCIFYGHLADQIGRRPTFLSACMLVFILGVIVGLSPWYWFFSLTRFILGVGCGGISIICIVFLVEYVEISSREIMVIMYRLPYNLGHGTLPALAIFIQDWRGLQISTSLFAIIYVSYFWVLPESPRWLFITGHLEHCIAVLNAGASHRKRATDKIRNIVEKAYDQLRMHNFSRNGTMLDLFTTRNMLKKTLILMFCWFSLFLNYYGVLESLTYLKGNIYKNFGISAWLTIPSTMLAYPVVVYIPRRYSLLMTFGFSALCLLPIPIVPNDEQQIWTLTLSTIVSIFNTVGSCVMHLLTAELYPTMLRNSGMGLSICSASFGILLAAYVTHAYGQFWTPALIFGSFSLISAFVVLFLPETKGTILLDTIEQSETFGRK